jgi:uncharacterized protein (TIGR02996 family)
MTTEEAFIRGIRERPDDDLTWSVYADWLEERGDPLGDLIRVEGQLEKLPATDPRRSDLEQRRRALEDATSFLECQRRLARCRLGARSRRGFVEELVLELSRWPAWDRSQTRGILDSLAAFLSGHPRFLALLRTFRIRGDLDYGSEKEFALASDVAAELLAFRWFAELATLDLGNVNGTLILGVQTVQVAVTHPNLERLGKLVLSGHPLGDQGAEVLAASCRLVHLSGLYLSGTGIGDQGARALAGAAPLAALTELDLRYNRITDEGARSLAASPYLVNLKKLKLHGNSIGPEGKRHLQQRYGKACLLPQLPGSERPRPGDWSCFECGARNFASRGVCYECQSPRPKARLREGDWLCPACNTHNFARRQTCHQCKTMRPQGGA